MTTYRPQDYHSIGIYIPNAPSHCRCLLPISAPGPSPTDEPDFVSSQLTPEPGEAIFLSVEGVEGEKKDSPTSSAGDQSQSEVRQQAQLLAMQQKVSNLELENRLLKREVASMNDELSGVMGRVREAGVSVGQYEAEIASLREQASRSDHVIRQLRSHEEDLQAMLEARDSQIQVTERVVVIVNSSRV